MGKSPGKWIKMLLFGKKSVRSNGAKGRNTLVSGYGKGHTTAKGLASAEKSPVISEPILVSTHSNGIDSESAKGNSSNGVDADASLISPASIGANNQGRPGPATLDDQENSKEQAAIKAQTAFRGFLARRAFRALKGVIRLQALVRGHLVRRQAVVTLHSTLGIIKLQALVRGKKVRASGIGKKVATKFWQGKAAVASHLDSRNGKVYPNAFVCKLLSFSLVVMPLRIQYEQGDPNLVSSWMQRWTSSGFWKPPFQPKGTVNSRSQAKRSGYAMETESGRAKRGVWKNSRTNVDANPFNVTSEAEKPKRNPRKATASTDSVQDHPLSELEKVKRNLRKVSGSSYAGISSEQEIETDAPSHILLKATDYPSDTPKQVINDLSEKAKKEAESSLKPKPDIEIASKSVEADGPVDQSVDNPPAAGANPLPRVADEENVSVVVGASSVKEEQTCNENQKNSRRRASFSAKSEYAENTAVNNTLPGYMQATESAKLKSRGQNSPRLGTDSAEKNGVTRRHSLPLSANGNVTLHSPRTQRIPQASGKGSIRSDRSLLSSRDANAEKLVQVEWRR